LVNGEKRVLKKLKRPRRKCYSVGWKKIIICKDVVVRWVVFAPWKQEGIK